MPEAGAGIFDRIVAAIDESAEAAAAAYGVSLLAPPAASLVLLGVTQPTGPVPPGFGVATVPVLEARHRAEDALAAAAGQLSRRPELRTRLLEGAPIPTLLAALEEERATLVSVGIHRHSRAAGIALGSVATALLHDAPCSVYVGRGSPAGDGSVSAITVGLDGSPGSAAALEVARELGSRLHAEVQALISGTAGVDRERIASLVGAGDGLTVLHAGGDAVDALLRTRSDLLIVGSRGLRGLSALGSVSERLAHRASCPVLVVRAP